MPIMLQLLYSFVLLALVSYCNGTTSVTVDFTKTLFSINPNAFGMDESAYDKLTTDKVQQARLQSLPVGYMRLSLQFAQSGNASSPVQCEPSGCDKSIPGDLWLDAVIQTKATPIILVPTNVPDATGLLRRYNIDQKRNITKWIIGNEPPGGVNGCASYCPMFNQVYDAMKAIDPTIKIGGPAAAFFDTVFLGDFIINCGSRADFVDFHQYGTGTDNLTDPVLLNQTNRWSDAITELKQIIQIKQPSRASTIEVHVGEWGCDWQCGERNNTSVYKQFATVWGASVLGRIISSGGVSMLYADKNGCLGALYDTDMPQYGAKVNDPMPVWWGIVMFTGGNGIFQPFGSQVATANVIGNSFIEAYASSNNDNIILINKHNSSNFIIDLSLTIQPGQSISTISYYYKSPSVPALSPPLYGGTLPFTVQSNVANATITLPPYSVYTYIVTLKPSSFLFN